jgi:hypothetical protein
VTARDREFKSFGNVWLLHEAKAQLDSRETPRISAPGASRETPYCRTGTARKRRTRHRTSTRRCSSRSRARRMAASRRAGTIGLLCLIPAGGAGYLYWDKCPSFRIDRAFVAARQFAIAPPLFRSPTTSAITASRAPWSAALPARMELRSTTIHPRPWRAARSRRAPMARRGHCARRTLHQA